MNSDRNERSDEPLLMPEVQRALVSTVRGGSAADLARKPKRLRSRVGGLALAAVLCSGTAVAASRQWNPFTSANPDAPTIATGPVPPDQMAILGVLRRPQADADRGPKISAQIDRFRAHDTGGVHLDGVRLLNTRPDGVTLLMPVTRQGNDDIAYPNERPDVICLVYGTDAHESAGCQVGSGSAYRCGDAADIRAGRMISGAQYGGRLELTGLVPDGIATIEVPMRGGPTITADVVDNSFQITEANAKGSFDRGDIRWRDAQGQVVAR